MSSSSTTTTTTTGFDLNKDDQFGGNLTITIVSMLTSLIYAMGIVPIIQWRKTVFANSLHITLVLNCIGRTIITLYLWAFILMDADNCILYASCIFIPASVLGAGYIAKCVKLVTQSERIHSNRIYKDKQAGDHSSNGNSSSSSSSINLEEDPIRELIPARDDDEEEDDGIVISEIQFRWLQKERRLIERYKSGRGRYFGSFVTRHKHWDSPKILMRIFLTVFFIFIGIGILNLLAIDSRVRQGGVDTVCESVGSLIAAMIVMMVITIFVYGATLFNVRAMSRTLLIKKHMINSAIGWGIVLGCFMLIVIFRLPFDLESFKSYTNSALILALLPGFYAEVIYPIQYYYRWKRKTRRVTEIYNSFTDLYDLFVLPFSLNDISSEESEDQQDRGREKRKKYRVDLNSEDVEGYTKSALNYLQMFIVSLETIGEEERRRAEIQLQFLRSAHKYRMIEVLEHVLKGQSACEYFERKVGYFNDDDDDDDEEENQSTEKSTESYRRARRENKHQIYSIHLLALWLLYWSRDEDKIQQQQQQTQDSSQTKKDKENAVTITIHNDSSSSSSSSDTITTSNNDTSSNHSRKSKHSRNNKGDDNSDASHHSKQSTSSTASLSKTTTTTSDTHYSNVVSSLDTKEGSKITRKNEKEEKEGEEENPIGILSAQNTNIMKEWYFQDDKTITHNKDIDRLTKVMQMYFCKHIYTLNHQFFKEFKESIYFYQFVESLTHN